MTRTLPVLALFALAACTGADTDGDGNPDWSIGGGNGDNIPTNVEIPAGDPDHVITGDLSEGSVIDIGFAESNYCWPATEDVNFNGSHVFYEFTQDSTTDLLFRVEPDNGVDVSIYYIQSDGGFQTPPEVASPWECDARYDATNDNNPGQAEVLNATRYNPYNVTVGVAGANGATSGGYTLQVWEVYGEPFDQE